MITVNVERLWYSNDCWTCDNFELTFDDVSLSLIKNAQEFLIKNPKMDKVVMYFEDYEVLFDDPNPDDTFQDLRIDVAMLYIYQGSVLFYCQDKWESGNQMESDFIGNSELGLPDRSPNLN